MLKRGFQFAPGYRLQEFLGRGQFGQVWRATAPGGAAAAIKFIDLTDGQGEKEYEGVRRVKQIRHANLMPITAIWLLDGQGKMIEEAPDEAIETIELGSIEAQGQSAVLRKPEVEPSWLAVSMLLGGMSLQRRLQECVGEGLPGIPPKELIAYMDESAKGIDYLNSPQHDLGEGPIAIQHSDVKPANIVLIGSSAVVCDFGLARILTRNQVTATSAAGTPAYMAPEAISGKPARTSDQYSLAVTYYHLRTGTLPVNDGSLWEVLDAHRQGKLKLGMVPEAEQEVLRKATDLNWENRFDTNLDMVDALREALRAEGTTKPSFVPASGSYPAVKSEPDPTMDAVPKSLKEDPTATIDLKTGQDTEPPADQAQTETQPFKQAEQPTTQGFLDETMPALDQGTAAVGAAGESVSESIKNNSKFIIGAIGGVIGLLLLGMIALSGKGETEPVPVPVEQNPEQLFAEALALFETDESAAVEKADQAFNLDPGLAQLSSGEFPGLHKEVVAHMLQNEKGDRLFSAGFDAEVFVWGIPDKGKVPAAPTPLSGSSDAIRCMSLSPDGARLLTGNYSDSKARVWDLQSENPEANALELDMISGEVLSVAWHPTKPIAISLSNNDEIGIWEIGRSESTTDSQTGAIARKSLIQLAFSVKSFEMDPSGRWLAVLPDSNIEDNSDVRIFAWDELVATFDESASPVPVMLGAKAAARMAFLQGDDVSRIAVGDSGGQVSVYALSDSPKVDDRTKVAHNGIVDAIRVVHGEDQRDFIVTGAADGSVHWWNRSVNGAERISRGFGDLYQPILCVDVSQDGRWVAAGAEGGNVWLWDTSEGKDSGAINFVTGATAVESVLIDNQSRWLIVGCDGGAIKVWDLNTAKLLAKTRPTIAAPLIEKEIQIDTNSAS
ncbi:MAG: protein kinase family protein [Rubripirellula sp.]